MITEKEKKIIKLMKLLGTQEGPKKTCMGSWRLMANLNNINVPDELLEELWESLDIDTLIDLYIPIYAKFLDDSQIDQLLSVIGSVEYQKFQTDLPQIIEEANKVTELWFKNRMDVFERKMQKLTDKYGEDDDSD